METSAAYNSIHEGPAIDAAVTRASEGGAIDVAIQAKPNPNLLDNWYFGNPVNQRGQTEYTPAWNGYSIDRWNVESDSEVVITLVNGGIHVKNTASTTKQFKQTLPSELNLSGKMVTISLLAGDVIGTVNCVFTQVSEPYQNSAACSVSKNGLFSASGSALTGQQKFVCSLEPGAEITLLAVKLELGSQQTLAHQDADGNWVLNEIPDYGEQLRRCQRYYLSNKQRNAYGKSTSATAAYVDIPTPVTMRALPAIKTGLIGHVICNGVKTTIASINPVKLNDESITLQLVLNTSVSVDYPVFLTDTKYALSADL